MSFIKGTYSITPRPIIISTIQSSIYGQTPTITNLYEVTSGTIVNGDSLNVSFKSDATRYSAAGNHQIIINETVLMFILS